MEQDKQDAKLSLKSNHMIRVGHISMTKMAKRHLPVITNQRKKTSRFLAFAEITMENSFT